jgi:hypothetical protein
MVRWPPVSSITVLLQQRLAAGDLDERTCVSVDSREHIVDRHLPAFMECVRRVAPRTAQIAGRQPDEHAQTAGVGRFALNRMEDLVNRQHFYYSTGMAKPTFYWKPT